ncbi:MAG: histidine kinase [Deltaproteobacteria bacterium HGW-Deltaproteobacteria-23]|nr:MAG: histidine kinase [Deltaproteobacteria bacterium HGW-Deltaproteobacteria-23]
MLQNILVVNQNEDFCGNISRFLASEGLKPFCATAATAMQKAEELRPDAIIIEIAMPELASIELVTLLHRSSSTRQIPVIVISEFPELEFELLHLFDFIGKPVNLRRLREDISDISTGKKKRTPPAREQLTAEEHLLFHDFLIRHSGLHFERRNIKMLERGLDSRMTALRIPSYKDYYDYLQLNMERRNELQKLLQFLTVGETFFFRYHGHFEALAKNTLADLLWLPAKKSLRIWSAGCSTGEEPYSIAMTIMEAIPDWKKRDIRIFATDINSRSLKRAQEGVYSAWKMRVTPKHYIDKYFTVIGESYLVKDEVKALVDFSYFNLQTLPAHDESFDVIFCRNVLIYFTSATTKMVVEMFANSLNPGGYLYLGHSETMVNISSRFERHIQAGSFYYRKKAVAVAEAEKPVAVVPPRDLQRALKTAKPAGSSAQSARPLIVKPTESINPDQLFRKGLGLLHQENYAAAAEVIKEVLLLQPHHIGAILADGQTRLAQGKSAEALDCCNRALALNDLLPGGYFLRGLVFEVDDRIAAALEEYRKAVLLKIDFIMPHYQMGKLSFSTDDSKTSARELRNCVRLLEKAGRGAVIPFSGGLSREIFLEQARNELAIVEAVIANQER